MTKQNNQKALEMLSEEQIACYHKEGYLILKNYLSMDIIEAIRSEIARLEKHIYGMTESDDRFDLEDSHKPDEPRLRRIKRPHTQSEIIRKLLYSDHILAPVRDLLGPHLRLHTSKLNMKVAGYGAAIDWHQDFAFYPHTNDDILAVAVIIDDMKSENGPLMVYPGTHTGPIYDHHAEGVFAGGFDVLDTDLRSKNPIEINGQAGSISLHHARLVHGSARNISNSTRRLLFFEILVADAFPIMGGMTRFGDIAEYNARMLCGKATLSPRLSDVPVRIPQPQPDKNQSIYEIQKHRKPVGV